VITDLNDVTHPVPTRRSGFLDCPSVNLPVCWNTAWFLCFDRHIPTNRHYQIQYHFIIMQTLQSW